MKKYIYLLVMLAALTLAQGCSDDGEPSSEAALYDIVCLAGDSDAGSVFTLGKPDSDDVITLTSRQRIDTELIPVGNRLLLMYVPVNGIAYQPGEITVKGYGTIVNGELAILSEDEIDGWDRTPVYLLSAWRSGNYLNIHARLPYDEKPRAFTLAMSESADGASYPDLYLVHALETDVTTFSRAYYASFDISGLLSDTRVKGFTLHINNSNLDLKEIKFEL